MTVIYEKTPTFEERILGATLIIVGKIQKLIRTEGEYNVSDQHQLQTIYSVNVRKALKGFTNLNSVKVRVLGDRAKISGLAEAVEGDRILLMLSPDYGPNMKEDSFVLYFSSGYLIQGEDQVMLDESTAKELANQKIPVDDRMVKLESIHSLIITIMKRKEKQGAMLEEVEPAELRKMPYPEISELPQPTNGGGRPSSPGSEPSETV
jgi:hypothetical protein